MLYLRYLYYNITLIFATCFGPHETGSRESNTVTQHETKQVCVSCWFGLVNLLSLMHGMNSIKVVMFDIHRTVHSDIFL